MYTSVDNVFFICVTMSCTSAVIRESPDQCSGFLPSLFSSFLVSLWQWLVMKAIETREQMGDYIRAYSIAQFHKTHSFPEVTTD